MEAAAVEAVVAIQAAAGPQARSADGRWRLSGLDDPPRLELRDANGQLVRAHPARSADGQHTSRVHAVLAVPQRKSFLVLFDTLPELWELSLDPQAEPIYDGLVHDFRMGEGVARPGYLGVRRIRLAAPLQQAFVAGSVAQLIGTTPPDRQGRRTLHVVHLDVRRTVAQRPWSPAPRPDLGVWLQDPRGDWLAMADAQQPGISLLELDRWQAVGCLDTPGPVHQLLHLDPGRRLLAQGRHANGQAWMRQFDLEAAPTSACRFDPDDGPRPG